MESPSTCAVRYEVECSTGRPFPCARAGDCTDVSATIIANATQAICTYRVRWVASRGRMVAFRSEVLRRWADDGLVDLHIGRLLHGVRDRARDRLGRNRHLV